MAERKRRPLIAADEAALDPALAAVAASARLLLDLSQHQRDHFPERAAQGSGWELLLVVYAAYAEARTLKATTAIRRAGIKMTTGLHVITRLEEAGLLETRGACADDRLVLLLPTEAAKRRMRDFLHTLPKKPTLSR